MKKLLLLIALSFPFSVSATGIPVVDVASLTQMVTDNLAKAKQWGLEAQQWAKQNGMDIDQYKEALKQGKDIYEQGEHYKKMVDGHFNFEDVLNDPLANEFYDLEEWRDVYDELEEVNRLAEKYGVKAAREDRRGNQETSLQKLALMNKFYQQSIKRNVRMKSLLDRFETVDTPAAKADVANAIAFEQTQIQNDEQSKNAMFAMLQDEADLKHSIESQKKIDTLFGAGIPRTKRN
jgi:type IV secretion system protein VirB5